ncbi:hypothetical protein BST27_20655 [Mycobacterium intermedium]|uniref:ASCH domain-containing protein n=1 Tax=Mycobacterium intermedium TaxID=28445 RepID=A0A1E3SBB4_MYCIE|nr:hypothetical protein [Mycobacterium intermedium]MCV6962295.1 hypothetical protein [Mycobacterium intermedium]ODQ99384.1 hypothetical protein BHQ20_17895 [Mycobacterium intermedium]OPE51157.1 hypothetical protein BV508_07530 [Mycobacterium intermedium]ORA98528.1 hypothetical protein BST27_20655 [Mycobacterium intermedium]
MLLNRATAEGIANGSISLVLRRWDAPRAKPGGTQRTMAGTIRIDEVVEHPPDYQVTGHEARAAGYSDAATAQAELNRRPAKHTYLISVSFVGADERPALAADDALTAADIAAIAARLDRLDAASDSGPWTRHYLRLISDNEAVRAPNLAAGEGLDVPRFKRRVRRLKELGLTISLDVGYRLSPRGRAFLEATC